MEQANFLMLVGLPASGKSTVAQQLINGRDDIVYISSDEYREKELGDVNRQDKNTYVFELMRIDTIEALKEGKHVVYDATNVSRKKRKGLLQQLPNNVEKIAYYISTEYRHIVEQNAMRERVVPHEVIDRMYKTMQIPIYSEGWDEIVFDHHELTSENKYDQPFTDAIRAEALLNVDKYELMAVLAQYFEEFFKIYDMPQDSKYHSFSVSRHIYYVYRHVLENWNPVDKDYEVMLWTALLHDVGKGFCKSFKNRKGEETRYANFIGHEYVSSQMAVHFLHKMNFSDEFIHKVATLIQFHMYLLDQNTSTEKLKGYVGEEMFEKLEFLRDADTQAH